MWIFLCFFFCLAFAMPLYVFYVPCGHLLGKGWPLGSRLWCLTVKLSLFHCIGILGQVWYLIVSIPFAPLLTCIWQGSVGLGKLWEVRVGKCKMDKNIAGKGKSTHNSFIRNQIKFLPVSSYQYKQATAFLEFLVTASYKNVYFISFNTYYF